MSYKLNAGVRAVGYDNLFQRYYYSYFVDDYTSVYGYYHLNDEKALFLNNYLYYKFSPSFSIGTYFRYEREWMNETANENIKYNDFDDDEIDSEIRYEDTRIRNYAGVLNFCFGKKLIKDISFRFTDGDTDIRQDQIYNDYHENKYNNYTRGYETDSEEGYFSTEENRSFGAAILVAEYENDYFRRFYLSADYSDEKLDYAGYDNYDRTVFEDELLDYHNVRNANRTADVTRKIYQSSAGYGANKIINNFELLYGLKINSSFADYKSDDSFVSYQMLEQVNQDSTVVEEYNNINDLSSFTKEYRVSGEFPLGIIYTINKNISILSGLGFTISRGKTKYNDDVDFDSWQTSYLYNSGIELKPFERLQIGIHFSNDLTSIKYWKMDFKYFLD